LIANDPRNSERIKPYIGGEEVNNSLTHAHHRYAIDFEDFPLRRDPAATHPWRQLREETQRAKLRSGIVSADYPWPVAADWPSLLDIVERRVKPKRLLDKREGYRRYWWRYAERRADLSRILPTKEAMLAVSRVSPQLGLARIGSNALPAESLVVFVLEELSSFAVVQSRVHEIWARFFSSSMKDDLRYAPSDCFETFPFPPGYETDAALEAIGQTYHDHRAALMVAANEGMTKTYNRFHKSDERAEPIRRFRELHDEMDRVVLRAYGWPDLADELRPKFLTEETEDDHTYQGRYFWPSDARDRVLARLLALNAARHAEEVEAGLAPTGTKKEAKDDEDDDVGQESLNLV
jgi:hypothetical protein